MGTQLIWIIFVDKSRERIKPSKVEEDEKNFKNWICGLVWCDPYPETHEVARLAWLAAAEFYRNQTNNKQEIEQRKSS